MKIEIKNRWDGSVIFAHEQEGNTIAITVRMALSARTVLHGSDLRNSNLRNSDLRGSDLSNSDLRGSDLSNSDLRNSNLSGSDLSNSNLRNSDLRNSNLSGSDLRGSDLTVIRDDIWAVLSSSPREVPALIDALKNGRVDGSTYTGACSCLVGTIAAARGVSTEGIDSLSPNSSRPAERFFLGISEGDTPETNQACALAHQWASEWLVRMQEAFGPALTVQEPVK